MKVKGGGLNRLKEEDPRCKFLQLYPSCIQKKYKKAVLFNGATVILGKGVGNEPIGYTQVRNLVFFQIIRLPNFRAEST